MRVLRRASLAGAGFWGAGDTGIGCLLSSLQMVRCVDPVTDFLMDLSGTAMVRSFGGTGELGERPTSLHTQGAASASQKPQPATCGLRRADGSAMPALLSFRPMSSQIQDVAAVSSQRPHESFVVAGLGSIARAGLSGCKGCTEAGTAIPISSQMQEVLAVLSHIPHPPVWSSVIVLVGRSVLRTADGPACGTEA